ncbi:hypothetical protein IEN91_04810 [Bacillus velezensis]|uniref:hypothetical protein n=1 Tax=Bacillus velezensis TaxID=492670 RepID=UPI0018C6327C|nr:hypothetical protein [Bacillus velezensis]QPK89765.1 hypothetical protein IEN91_04810 [Bacillus velezensis]
MIKKHVVPMWLIHDTLFHYSNAERAKKLEDGKDMARLVHVGVDNDYFINMWQPSEWFDAWIFNNAADAIKEVEEYNKNIL